jgi:N-acetyl sugar amidotransferase
MSQYEAYFGLPQEVKFCKKCVISNQRPQSTVEFKNNKEVKKKVIAFDEEGICSACRYNETKDDGIDWKAREELLFELLEPYRSKDGSYDVLVPSSGGKDSSFTAHILKKKYGMNPLSVTWSPHMYTKAGWNNFRNLTHIGGVDNILYTPNGELHRYLTKLALKNLGHPFQPFIHGQKIIGPMLAKKFDIPLIMYGENQAEYGNDVEDNKNIFMKPDFFSWNRPVEELEMGGVKVGDILKETQFNLGDFKPYIPPTSQELLNSDAKVAYLGFFERWDPQECYYYAVENTGFTAADERSSGTYSKYTEIDDKLVPFHFYLMYIKFGIGRATYDAAQEIRNDKIDREEGVHLVRRYDHEIPEIFMNDFLEYVDMDRKEFDRIVDSFRSPHLWLKNVNGEWSIRHNVYRTGVDD